MRCVLEEVVTSSGGDDTASEDGGTGSGGDDRASEESRARIMVKSSPPPGAMYSLLLLAHMTLAVTASTTFTAGFTPKAPQTVTHADALTDRHTDVATVHIQATTGVPGTSAVHKDARTDRHTDVATVHIPATTRVPGTSAVHTDARTDRHTDVATVHIPATTGVPGTSAVHTDAPTDRHTDAATVHIAASTEILETTAIHTVHHSTFISEHHSTAIHPTFTEKALQSIPEITHTANITESLSVPNISVALGNGFQITCISERGPQVIHYELIQGERIVENMTIHGGNAATFQLNIAPGSNEIYCRARTQSGEEERSKALIILGATPEIEDKPGDRTKPDKEERDAAPKFLISLTYILTSVSQPVQDLNFIIICVCGPIFLILLLLVFLTHFCNCRGRKVESTSQSNVCYV